MTKPRRRAATLTMRVTVAMRQGLEQTARLEGRSLSRVAERWLDEAWEREQAKRYEAFATALGAIEAMTRGRTPDGATAKQMIAGIHAIAAEALT